MDIRKRVWSTDAVPPGQRLDYWIGAICEAFLQQHARVGNAARFAARLEGIALDTLRVNWVTAEAQSVFRRDCDIARGSGNYYYLLCCTTSAWRVCQEGVQDRLLPGDVALIDSRRRYELHFPESYSNLAVQLPIDWLETWLPAPEALLGRRLDGQHGWGQALSSLLCQMTLDRVAALSLPAHLVADQVGGLLALASGGLALTAAGCDRRDGLLKKIQQEIRSRCVEHGLVAASVAHELGMSVRTLHRHLASAGTTFADALMAERMAVADRMLASAVFNRLSIAEIGRRAGLVDPSHFARAYKRRRGLTPAQARAVA